MNKMVLRSEVTLKIKNIENAVPKMLLYVTYILYRDGNSVFCVNNVKSYLNHLKSFLQEASAAPVRWENTKKSQFSLGG